MYQFDERVCDIFDGVSVFDNHDKNRKQIISELDCLVGYMYGLSEEQIKEIARTFNKYYANKEVEQWF